MRCPRIPVACWLAVATAAAGLAAAAEPGVRGVMSDGTYVREPSDRRWQLTLVGTIPSHAGICVVVHDASGARLQAACVPHGTYTDAAPFRLTVEPDGRAGDYRIVIVGHQQDMLGLAVPRTDLPQEVYGGGTLVVAGPDDARLFFGGPEDVAGMKLAAHLGDLRILDADGEVVADTRDGGHREGPENVIAFPVTAGRIYQLERHCTYFRSLAPDVLFLALSPERWFRPDPALDRVAWWEIAP
jgi:hypothetical protein